MFSLLLPLPTPTTPALLQPVLPECSASPGADHIPVPPQAGGMGIPWLTFLLPAPVPGSQGGVRVAVGVALGSAVFTWKPWRDPGPGWCEEERRLQPAPSGWTIGGSGAPAATAMAIVLPGTSPAPRSTSSPVMAL